MSEVSSGEERRPENEDVRTGARGGLKMCGGIQHQSCRRGLRAADQEHG